MKLKQNRLRKKLCSRYCKIHKIYFMDKDCPVCLAKDILNQWINYHEGVINLAKQDRKRLKK